MPHHISTIPAIERSARPRRAGLPRHHERARCSATTSLSLSGGIDSSTGSIACIVSVTSFERFAPVPLRLTTRRLCLLAKVRIRKPWLLCSYQGQGKGRGEPSSHAGGRPRRVARSERLPSCGCRPSSIRTLTVGPEMLTGFSLAARGLGPSHTADREFHPALKVCEYS